MAGTWKKMKKLYCSPVMRRRLEEPRGLVCCSKWKRHTYTWWMLLAKKVESWNVVKKGFCKILHQKENLQFAFNPTLFYWSNYNDNNFVWEMQKSGSLHRMCHQQVQIEACRVFKNHSKCLVFELDNHTYRWCNEHTVCSISIVWPLLLSNLHTCSCKSVLYDLWFVQLLLLKKLNSRSVK